MACLAGNDYCVECPNPICLAMGPSSDLPDAAAYTWNNPPFMEEANAEIARLRGVLRDMQALLHDRYADESVLLGSCMVITDKALGGEDV